MTWAILVYFRVPWNVTVTPVPACCVKVSVEPETQNELVVGVELVLSMNVTCEPDTE
jgi:hypothetical protein